MSLLTERSLLPCQSLLYIYRNFYIDLYDSHSGLLNTRVDTCNQHYNYLRPKPRYWWSLFNNYERNLSQIYSFYVTMFNIYYETTPYLLSHTMD